MSEDVLILKRDELYEAVWSEPVQKLAAKYFISGPALAKICKKLDVPVPGRGYWRRAQFGTKGRRPPLRPLRNGERSTHVIWGHRRRSAQLLGPEVQQAIAHERTADARVVVVEEELASPHPLVKRSKGSLWRSALKAKELRAERACLDITVTRAQLNRALRVMDALLKALETRRHEVYVSEPETITYRYGGGTHRQPSATGVRIGDTEVEFSIDEVMDKGRPTGRLALVLHGGYCDLGRRTWRDGKKQRVENCLNEFIASIIETAERRRLDRLEREQREREAAERRRREEEQQRRRELEAARRRDLVRRLRDMEFASRVRRLVDAVEQRVPSEPLPNGADELTAWVSWARNVANEAEDRAVTLTNSGFPTLGQAPVP